MRYDFIHNKPDTLRYAIFMEVLKLAEGGGHFYKHKRMNFRLKFIQKEMHFPLRFYLQKSRHFASHFYMKQMLFALRLIAKIY